MKYYPYAVGRIRAIERSLLTGAKLEQMITAPSDDEVKRVLADAGYEAEGGTDEILSSALEKTYALLKELVPDSPVFDLFLYKNDYHNLKVLLKSTLAGADGQDAFYGLGSVDVDTLRSLYHENRLSELSPHIAEAAAEAAEIYAHTGDFRLADVAVEKIAFRHMNETAVADGTPYVVEIVRIMTDLTNIKIMARVRAMGKDEAFLENALMDGGALKKSTLLAALKDSAALAGTPYEAVGAAGADGFTALEKAADDYLIAYAKSAKMKSITIEPLVAYLLAKETEIKAVRIILVGRENRVDSDSIRERLRETYV